MMTPFILSPSSSPANQKQPTNISNALIQHTQLALQSTRRVENRLLLPSSQETKEDKLIKKYKHMLVGKLVMEREALDRIAASES